LIFNDKINTSNNPTNLFQITLVDINSLNYNKIKQNQNDSNFGTGEIDPNGILAAKIYQNREIRLYQDLIKDEYAQKVIATLENPDSIFSYHVGPENVVQSVQL
jgi:hypothetical protein